MEEGSGEDMTIPWTEEIKERAKREELYLVKLQLQGKHAGRGNIEFSGNVSDGVAKKLHLILAEMISDLVLKKNTTPPQHEGDSRLSDGCKTDGIPWEKGNDLGKSVDAAFPKQAGTALEITLCDHPAGCEALATSKGFIAGIRSNFCNEHKLENAIKNQCKDFVDKKNTETVRKALQLRTESVLLLDLDEKDGEANEGEDLPWCESCESYHHPDNESCLAERDALNHLRDRGEA